MTDFDSYQFGGVVYPLPSQTAGTSLRAVCDPALDKLIEFLAFSIDLKLGTALKDAVAAGNPPIAFNVKKTLGVDPIANVAKSEQVSFPLFCIWRDKSSMSQRTLNWRQDIHKMGWAYMLPPMTLEQADKFSHVLHAVVTIVNESLNQGFDPAYNSGERVVGGNLIVSARCTEARYEPYRLGDLTESHFHSVFGDLEVTEQGEPYTTGLTPITGIDTTITDESVQESNPIEIDKITTDVR